MSNNDLPAIASVRSSHFAVARPTKSEVLRAFPEWQDKGPAFDRACELTRSLLEGLLINRDIWDDPAGEDGVIRILNMTLQMLRKGEIAIPEPVEPKPKAKRAPAKRVAKAKA